MRTEQQLTALVEWLREGAKPNEVTPKARRTLCSHAAEAIEELRDVVPYVGTAWAHVEQDSPEAILEGCLLVVANSHEEAYDEIVQHLTEMGAELEEYAIVIRRAK